jgi:kynurenine formamidase
MNGHSYFLDHHLQLKSESDNKIDDSFKVSKINNSSHSNTHIQ